MNDINHNVPIRLPGGGVWHLCRVPNGYFCPVCGYGSLSSAPFLQNDEGIIGSYDSCHCCKTEFGTDLTIDPEETLQSLEAQLLRVRVTWLCRAGWPESVLFNLKQHLGVTDEQIREYQTLAGTSKHIDERFRAVPPPPGWFHSGEAITCPCCGHIRAVAFIFGRCGFCGWVYAPQQEIAPHDANGPNCVSFVTAQSNYIALGAITPELARRKRQQQTDLGIDPGWKPLDTRGQQFDN
jgi:rubredoxin